MMEKELTQTFFLSAGETNAEQELSLSILTAKIIDIATAHANSLGVGNPQMRDLNAGWVLSRLTIEMETYPRVNETYCLSTWVEEFNKHFSVRSFKVSSPDGHVYGYARSIWMVMSYGDHSNVGLGHLALPEGSISGFKAPVARQAKHRDLTDCSDPYRFSFGYSCLDSYRHVNTVRYVELLLNQYTLDEMDATVVRRLEMSFLHETKAGVPLLLLREDDNMTSAFQIKDPEGTPHLFARVVRELR